MGVSPMFLNEAMAGTAMLLERRMPDPLDYRERTTSAPPKRSSATRGVITVGVTIFVISVALMFLPLLIPLGQLAKFVVTPAFIGACIGLSITANAGIDAWRRRRR
jgi:hypothetical protein